MGIYEIKYVPRTAKKSQVIADFIVEIQSFEPTEKELKVLSEEGMQWVLNTDGVSNKEGARIGVIVESFFRVILEEAFWLEKQMMNNEAEYEALIYGLELALKLGVQNLKVLLDSELVLRQVNKTFEAKDQKIRIYCDKVSCLMKCFRRIDIHAIKRELNARANQLAKGAAYGKYEKKNKFMTTGEYPSEVNMIEMEDQSKSGAKKESWMDPIIDYLKICKESEDKNQARRLRIKAARYTLLDGVLYKKSFLGPLLQCITREESEVILKTIHLGICENHSRGRSLAHKAFMVGYFWPYMMQDA